MVYWDGRCLQPCSGPPEAQPGPKGSPSCFYQQLSVPKAEWERTGLPASCHFNLSGAALPEQDSTPTTAGRADAQHAMFLGRFLLLTSLENSCDM